MSQKILLTAEYLNTQIKIIAFLSLHLSTHYKTKYYRRYLMQIFVKSVYFFTTL